MSKLLTESDLAAIRVRADAATPPPWEIVVDWAQPYCHIRSIGPIHSFSDDPLEFHEPYDPDPQFAAHARDDVPHLLDLVDYLRRRLDAAEAVIQEDERLCCLSQDVVWSWSDGERPAYYGWRKIVAEVEIDTATE